MFGIESVGRRVSNICREGVVSNVYPERCSCRVTFDDKNGMVSAELPVLTPFSIKNKLYKLPDIGERVVVLMAGNDIKGGAGYVVGSLFTAENPPPESNENLTKLEFGDRTFISYDRERHEFKIQFNDESSIVYDGESHTFSVYIKGDIEVEGKKRLDVLIDNEIDIESRADIEMQGRNIRLN